jgi:hypothetical protein
MHQIRSRTQFAEMSRPVEALSLTGMGREAAQHMDDRLDRGLVSEDMNPSRTRDRRPSEGAWRVEDWGHELCATEREKFCLR